MKRLICFFMVLLFAGLISIQSSTAQSTKKQPKKVYYINSYYEGYEHSDAIEKAIREYFYGLFVVIETYYLQAKQHDSEEAIQYKVNKILEQIEEYEPDVIIASDDAAIKYVIEPHFKDSDIPVVFCGVDWSAKKYDLSTDNITGMIEVEPIDQSIDTLREYYPDIKTVTVITDQSESEKNNQNAISKIFEDLGVEANFKFVKDIYEWKEAFVKANKNSDVIYLPTNGNIKEWNTGEVHEFVKETIKQPVFTCDEYMMAYSNFGLTQIPAEQGKWAARTALHIIRGTSPDQFEVTKNKETKAYFNPVISEHLGFEPKPELKEQCEIIIRHK